MKKHKIPATASIWTKLFCEVTSFKFEQPIAPSGTFLECMKLKLHWHLASHTCTYNGKHCTTHASWNECGDIYAGTARWVHHAGLLAGGFMPCNHTKQQHAWFSRCLHDHGCILYKNCSKAWPTHIKVMSSKLALLPHPPLLPPLPPVRQHHQQGSWGGVPPMLAPRATSSCHPCADKRPSAACALAHLLSRQLRADLSLRLEVVDQANLSTPAGSFAFWSTGRG